MQSMLYLHGSYGLPLSVSGIFDHLSVSKEMADHDRRREAMKKQKSECGNGLPPNPQTGIQRNLQSVLEFIQDEVDRDLASVLQDLSFSACTAKAA